MAVQEIGQKVAMHAVAMKPRYLSPQSVPAEALEGDATRVTGIARSCMHQYCSCRELQGPHGLQRSPGVAWAPQGLHQPAFLMPLGVAWSLGGCIL